MKEEDLKEAIEKIPKERIDELANKTIMSWLGASLLPIESISEILDVHRPEEDAVMGKFKTLFDLRIQLIHHCFSPLRMPDENCLMIKDARTREETIYNVESKEDIKEFLCQYNDDLFDEPVED